VRRSFAVHLLTLVLALFGAGAGHRAPQALRAWIDPAAEVSAARPARPATVVARRPPVPRPRVVIAVVAPVSGTRAWPPDRDVLALKHARLI
jgi:hypothetical protein